MTSLAYGLLLMLRQGEQLTPDLYAKFDEYTDTHIRLVLKQLIENGFVELVDRVKMCPGEPGRPVNKFGILPEGLNKLEDYERYLGVNNEKV